MKRVYLLIAVVCLLVASPAQASLQEDVVQFKALQDYVKTLQERAKKPATRATKDKMRSNLQTRAKKARQGVKGKAKKDLTAEEAKINQERNKELNLAKKDHQKLVNETLNSFKAKQKQANQRSQKRSARLGVKFNNARSHAKAKKRYGKARKLNKKKKAALRLLNQRLQKKIDNLAARRDQEVDKLTQIHEESVADINQSYDKVVSEAQAQNKLILNSNLGRVENTLQRGLKLVRDMPIKR
jgi:hypothetical protein